MTTRNVICIAYVLLFTGLSSCSDDEIQQQAGPVTARRPIPGLPRLPASPYSYNNDGSSNATVALGRVLFYDKSLSGDKTTSCASCHQQSLSFSDNKALSNGHGVVTTDRNAMGIQNLPMQSFLFSGDPTAPNPYGSASNSNSTSIGGFFWDGREVSLPGMVLKPLENFNEMGNVSLNDVMRRIAATSYYDQLFKAAFPNGGTFSMDQKVGLALAGFVSSIRTTSTKYDLDPGGDQFSPSEKNGMILFKTKYNCDGCHHIDETLQSSPRFANIGLDVIYVDRGLAQTTRETGDEGKFIIPSLRNVEFTAPYMHDGRFASLEEVIKHYSDGIVNHPNLHASLKDKDGTPLKLNISDDEMHDLVAFLHTLSDRSILTDPKFSDPFQAH